MSVFGSIVSAIFGSKHAASVTGAAASSAPSPSAGSAKGTSAPLSIHGHGGWRVGTVRWDVHRFGDRRKADLES